MLNIDEILNISHIQGSVIYTRDGMQKMLYEIIDIRNENREYVFDNLISASNAMVQMIFLKQPMPHEFLDSYLTNLLERNINKEYITEVLHHIDNFRKKESDFSLYRVYCIICMSGNLSDEKTITALFETLSITYKKLEGKQIQEFIYNLFL